MSARDKRLEKAQMRVLFTVPFFAPGVCKLPVVWDDTIPTACTDGKCIRWSTKYFDSLDDQMLVTVLCHEVMHCLLGHLWRAPGGADHDTWNEACDHAVNLQLEEFAQSVVNKKLANPLPFPDGVLKNPAFKDKPEELIYSMLFRQKPPGGQGGLFRQKPPGGQGGPQGQGGKGGAAPGGGGGKPGNKPGQAPGSGASFGQFTIQDPTAADQGKQKTDWEHTFIQSCTLGKGRGDLPGCMARVLGDLLDPKVPWYEVLRNWLREQANDDWDWQKPNLYYDCEFILPKLESEKISAVVFATDTSGSIDQDCLLHFQSEKQACLDDLRPSKLVDIYCDARIHKVAEYTLGDRIATDAPGGGGTDFRPVFAHVADMPVQPKCLVYLTDLWGSFPDEAPEYPVIWVTWDPDRTAPFGDVIRV